MSDTLPPALREALTVTQVELDQPVFSLEAYGKRCMAAALRWANGNINHLWDAIAALEQEAQQ